MKGRAVKPGAALTPSVGAISLWRYEAPCGQLLIGAYRGRLCLCDWQEGRRRRLVDSRLRRALGADFEEGRSALTDEAERQLDEYFAGRRRAFELPLLLVGTDFQRAVWEALLSIPYGATVSYAELARRIGRPDAVRPVANAVGANALSVVVPCHRVVGSDHSLTGYGGGLEAKRWLLALEQSRAQPTLFDG